MQGMDGVLLVMSLLVVSGAIGLALAWVATSLVFTFLLRRPTTAGPSVGETRADG